MGTARSCSFLVKVATNDNSPLGSNFFKDLDLLTNLLLLSRLFTKNLIPLTDECIGINDEHALRRCVCANETVLAIADGVSSDV